MGGLCPAARAGRPRRQPRPQLCLCRGARGRACGPASSWPSTSSSCLARAPVPRGVGGHACSTSCVQSCSPQGGWGSPGVTRDFLEGEGDHRGPGGMAGALWEGGSLVDLLKAVLLRSEGPGRGARRAPAVPGVLRRVGGPGPGWHPRGRPNASGPATGSRSRPPAAAPLLRLAPPALAAAPPPPSSQFTACSRGRGRGRSATSTSPRQAPAPSYGGAAEQLAQRPCVTSRRTR